MRLKRFNYAQAYQGAFGLGLAAASGVELLVGSAFEEQARTGEPVMVLALSK